MARSKLPIKIAVALGLLAGLGVLFLRSVRGSRSAPYTVEARRLKNWTLALEPASSPSDPVLVLRPSTELVEGLFHQIFMRAMESLSTPAVPAIPLLLKGEFDRAFAGQMTPDALLAVARKAGLDTITVVPRCLAYRRRSDPGGTQQLYFVLFDAPELGRFREQLGQMLDAAAAPRGDFDPAALSPALFIAESGSSFSHWTPVRADAKGDCVAPIESSSSS